MEIILALGSNIGEKKKNLESAISLLTDKLGPSIAQSTIISSEPVDYIDQPKFLNMVVAFNTSKDLSPRRLLEITQSVEKEMGRIKVIPKGPRNIDIDILYFGNFKVNETDLIIPHPEIRKREFVINPLLEIKKSISIKTCLDNNWT